MLLFILSLIFSKQTGTEARYAAFLNARESRKGKPFNRLGSVSGRA